LICRRAARACCAVLPGGLWLLACAAASVADAPLHLAPGAAMPLELVSNCAEPRPGALDAQAGAMVFTLHPGDIGGCRSDGAGARPHDAAPHMERIEVRSPYLARPATYRITLDLRLSGQHASGPDTSVLQLHQWHARDCLCSPPLMLGFDAQGRMVARVLIGQGRHRRHVLPGLTRQGLADRWVPVVLEVENVAGFAAVSVQVDGRPALSERLRIDPRGALFVKAGLYRRGRSDIVLPVDQIALRNPRIARIASVR
jgi:hypothetical protein